MANESNIIGVIEIYKKDFYDKVESAITGGSLKENFFNICINKSLLKNTGSLLIPFAKSFRADQEDEKIILEKTNEIIQVLSFVEIFSIEIFCDFFYSGKSRYLFLYNENEMTFQKYLYEFMPVPISSSESSGKGRD